MLFSLQPISSCRRCPLNSVGVLGWFNHTFDAVLMKYTGLADRLAVGWRWMDMENNIHIHPSPFSSSLLKSMPDCHRGRKTKSKSNFEPDNRLFVGCCLESVACLWGMVFFIVHFTVNYVGHFCMLKDLLPHKALHLQ